MNPFCFALKVAIFCRVYTTCAWWNECVDSEKPSAVFLRDTFAHFRLTFSIYEVRSSSSLNLFCRKRSFVHCRQRWHVHFHSTAFEGRGPTHFKSFSVFWKQCGQVCTISAAFIFSLPDPSLYRTKPRILSGIVIKPIWEAIRFADAGFDS